MFDSNHTVAFKDAPWKRRFITGQSLVKKPIIFCFLNGGKKDTELGTVKQHLNRVLTRQMWIAF